MSDICSNHQKSEKCRILARKLEVKSQIGAVDIGGG